MHRIEEALAAGFSHAEVYSWLDKAGVSVSFQAYRTSVQRLRHRKTRVNGEIATSIAQSSKDAAVKQVEFHDDSRLNMHSPEANMTVVQPSEAGMVKLPKRPDAIESATNDPSSPSIEKRFSWNPLAKIDINQL